jgi:transposase InsO family protein
MRANRERYPDREMAGFFGVSNSAYYRWAKYGVSERRSKTDAELTALIRDIVLKPHRRYGSPRVWEELRRVYGKRVSLQNVARLMREQGLNATRRRKYLPPTNSNHGLVVCKNILDRQFDAGRPGEQGCLTSRSYGPPGPGGTGRRYGTGMTGRSSAGP